MHAPRESGQLYARIPEGYVLPNLEFREVTEDELPYVSYLCLWGISHKQKEAMKEHMEKRLTWIKEMWSKGLKIIVALGPRKGKKGLIEYLPIESAPEPVTGKSALFLDCIWVLPRFQNTGLGRRLLQHFLEDAKKVGGASVLTYEGDKWFGYFDYMPTGFFTQFGFREVSRDDTRVLLHLDLGAHTTPKLLTPRVRGIPKEGKMVVDVFCNSQCPWCGWMADEISRNVKRVDVSVREINTDMRAVIDEFGLARGVSVKGAPLVKRMAAWSEVKSALERALH